MLIRILYDMCYMKDDDAGNTNAVPADEDPYNLHIVLIYYFNNVGGGLL